MEIAVPMDPLYLVGLVSAEKKFWRSGIEGDTASHQCGGASGHALLRSQRRHGGLERMAEYRPV